MEWLDTFLHLYYTTTGEEVWLYRAALYGQWATEFVGRDQGVDEDIWESCFMLVNMNPRRMDDKQGTGTTMQSQWSAQELEYLPQVITHGDLTE